MLFFVLRTRIKPWQNKGTLWWQQCVCPAMLPVLGKTWQHCCAPRRHKPCIWRFSETFCMSRTQNLCPPQMLRAWQNESTFGKHYHVGTLAATMCHSFCRPLGSMRVQRVQNSVLVWTANSQACSSTLTIFRTSRGSTENYRLIALNESASELSDGKAGLHVRRKHKHKRKHKPRVNRDDTSARKRNACLFLCFALSRFTRGLCLCLCLCLRRTCKPALGWG